MEEDWEGWQEAGVLLFCSGEISLGIQWLFSDFSATLQAWWFFSEDFLYFLPSSFLAHSVILTMGITVKLTTTITIQLMDNLVKLIMANTFQITIAFIVLLTMAITVRLTIYITVQLTISYQCLYVVYYLTISVILSCLKQCN